MCNTNKAYDPKTQEYYAFCDSLYPSVNNQFKYIVDAERLYRFLFYQSFCEKKSQKGWKKSEKQGFDRDNYNYVMNK